ncbi:FKBP-type peptidyl-prolyl cis-trans isomerase FkpA [Duganella sp. CF402]|uniref:FKBP-type peptidyl-prolyl cis-trans isomerase n=1 Tax=unclassified Duganella TaxID=2636909 RepID=UPI0008C70ACD|nr:MULTISPECIES: FKBP-type peptidyl-prolyl cis-trans isomerase [unclassified Duganella]RZT09044.1 peptidylprolyl isomerase/FKBP-type peptidyl-prolyl cis-trans isomerase FkpA [Duganella sp. BK701]SEL72487.1 FKBP-type peptidyl-prolyl cis-trans isomerase FkpA [Duganella sp. CF402]
MKSTFQMIAAAVCAIVLVACGGGGDSATSTPSAGVQPPTALKIEDQVIGTGAEAATGKTASVRYTGYLFDGTRTDLRGTKFDSNVGSASPFSFVVNANPLQVITGFNNGVAGMKVGGKRVITIPPSLGYGASANGAIPANSTLIFEVELVAVN